MSCWLNTFAGELNIDFIELDLWNSHSRRPLITPLTGSHGNVTVRHRWRRAPTLLWRGNAIVLRRPLLAHLLLQFILLSSYPHISQAASSRSCCTAPSLKEKLRRLAQSQRKPDTAPARATVRQSAHYSPDRAVIDVGWQRLAVWHIGTVDVLDDDARHATHDDSGPS